MSNKQSVIRLELNSRFDKTLNTEFVAWSRDKESYKFLFEFGDGCGNPLILEDAKPRILLEFNDDIKQIYSLDIDSKHLGLATFTLPSRILGYDGFVKASVYVDYEKREHDLGNFRFKMKKSHLDCEMPELQFYVSEFDEGLKIWEEKQKEVTEITDVLDGRIEKIETKIVENDLVTHPEFEPFKKEIIDAGQGKESLTKRLNDDHEEVLNSNNNLFFYPNFEYKPEIIYRSKIYTENFVSGRFIEIESRGYVSVTGDKDFAILLKEPVGSGQELNIIIDCEFTGNNNKVAFRMAYGKTTFHEFSNGKNKNIHIKLKHPEKSQANTFLYIDFLGDAKIKFEKINIFITLDEKVDSINQLADYIGNQKFDVNNTKESVNGLIQTAMSYDKNLSKFSYGNFNTAFDTDTKLVDGKYQIDCSSFVSLCIQGITFEKSKYQNKENNISDWGYLGFDAYKYRYSGEMANELTKKGYTFEPYKDLSNLMTGDIVFYSWKENYSEDSEDFRRRSFMGIQHVGLYLGRRGDNSHRLLQLDNGFTTAFYDATEDYMKQCVLVARIPLKFNGSKKIENISKFPNKKYKSEDSTAAKVELSEYVDSYDYLTVVIDGKTIDKNHYFILMDDNYSGIESGISFNLGCDKWVFYAPFKKERQNRLSIGVGDRMNGNGKRNSEINSIYIFKGLVDIDNITKENFDITKDLGVLKSVTDNTWAGVNPYSIYTIDRNKMFIEVNLPFKESYQGNLTLGKIPYIEDYPKSVKRIQVFMREKTTQSQISGHLFIANGNLVIEPQDKNKFFEQIMINATISLN